MTTCEVTYKNVWYTNPAHAESMTYSLSFLSLLWTELRCEIIFRFAYRDSGTAVRQRLSARLPALCHSASPMSFTSIGLRIDLTGSAARTRFLFVHVAMSMARSFLTNHNTQRAAIKNRFASHRNLTAFQSVCRLVICKTTWEKVLD